MEPEATISTHDLSARDALEARLGRYGLLAATGEDARGFLHAQLTSDIAQLPAGRARLAGWCSAKGRLLATFLVVPRDEGFFLQLARDLLPAVAKRLAMFVLRSKLRIADASDAWAQLGLWGPGAAARLGTLGIQDLTEPMAVKACGDLIAVKLGDEQFLLLVPEAQAGVLAGRIGSRASSEDGWALLEIRAGRPLVSQATQDLFLPQMVNLESLGGVDFRKGCYPGQEIVARTQYRGQLKRRMIRAGAPRGLSLREGQDLYSDDLPGQASGTVVNVAPTAEGSELLAVVQIGSVERRAPLRVAPEGTPLELLPLPYAP